MRGNIPTFCGLESRDSRSLQNFSQQRFCCPACADIRIVNEIDPTSKALCTQASAFCRSTPLSNGQSTDAANQAATASTAASPLSHTLLHLAEQLPQSAP